MTLRTSLLTPPDTIASVNNSFRRGVLENKAWFGPPPSSEVRNPASHHDDTLTTIIKHCLPFVTTASSSSSGRREQTTRQQASFTGTLAGHHPWRQSLRYLVGFGFVQVCVCVCVCTCVTGRMHCCMCARLKFVCVCTCAMPPLRLNTFVRLESADGVTDVRG